MPTFVLVQNSNRGLVRPPRVRICDSFACRLRGLMFHSGLARDEGLLLVTPRASRLDSAIHMLFVPFDLAIFWIDSNMQVVDKVMAKSWRPAYIPARAAEFVLEVHPDLLADYDIGERVEFINA
jgi:uncharacterized membrane protein (UPF0127 family)